MDYIFDDFEALTDDLIRHCRVILRKTGGYDNDDLIVCADDPNSLSILFNLTYFRTTMYKMEYYT